MVLLSIRLVVFFLCPTVKEDIYNHRHHSFTLTMFVAGFIFCYCCRPLLPLTYRNISHAAGTWHSGPSFRPGRRPSCLAPRRLRLQRTPPCRSSPGNVCWHRSWSTAFSCGTKESFGRGKHIPSTTDSAHSFKDSCIYCQMNSTFSQKWFQGGQEQKGSRKRKLQMFLLVSDDTLGINIHQRICYCVTKEPFVPWTHLINNPSV